MSVPGRLWYLLYHQPLAAIARSWREGGPWQQWIDARARRAMISAAARLPVSPPLPPGAPSVHLLTGRRFWYQTAFCVHSLRRQGAEVSPVFLDDGTLDSNLAAEARRIFPDARLVPVADATAHLDRTLPVDRFPSLRRQRLSYVHLRKLTDVHAGNDGWRLVLDSDMLFFRRPDALLAWLARPECPIHMLDVHDAYGYPTSALAALTGAPPPARVNVGVCGLRSETIDWNRLEDWTANLLARHGSSYYLEQALVALLLTGRTSLRLSAGDYQLMPTLAECRKPSAAMHHYVALSKRGYFRYSWRLVA